jgi:hypothetical protein
MTAIEEVDKLLALQIASRTTSSIAITEVALRANLAVNLPYSALFDIGSAACSVTSRTLIPATSAGK